MARSEKLLDIIAWGKCEVPYTKSVVAFALYSSYIKQETTVAGLLGQRALV